MKKTFSLLLVILMLLSLSACGTSDSPDTDGASGSQSGTFDTLIYGSNDYTRINPAMPMWCWLLNPGLLEEQPDH